MTSKASAVMRKPLIERTKEVTSHNDGEGGMTVVEFLEEQCVNIVAVRKSPTRFISLSTHLFSLFINQTVI